MEGDAPSRTTREDRSRRRLLVWAVALTLAVGVVGWLIGSGGWPGARSGCIAAGDCSCEAFSAGVVVQPINAISSLALVLAGIGQMWSIPLGTRDRRRRLTFAATVIGLGIGSTAFHASMTEWGGWMDLVGIHLFLGVVLLIDLAAVHDRSDRWLLQTIGVGGSVAAGALWLMDNSFGKYTAGALVVAVAIVEWRISQTDLRPDRRWLWWAVGLFSAGLALQVLGRGGGLWCDPAGVLQPHALWHLVAAGATIALARHLFLASGPRSERRRFN